MIYFTSDLHFNHDKEFIYKPRGFDTVYEMNTAIIHNWNSIINTDDEVYVLGDLMLADNDAGIALIKQLKGSIHIILGNHDTDTRVNLYNSCYNVVDICYADKLKYGKCHFFLTHYPCITGNIEKEHLTQTTLNLFGHTHSKDKFYNNNPCMYNVAVDAHNCSPVSIEEVLQDIRTNWYREAE